jgi:carboxymethylenebutenolidase
MREKNQDVQTSDGAMDVFVVHPDGDGPFPVVVLYMDAPGIREELCDFTRRIAAEGYFAVLPDLYYRRGRIRFDLSTMGKTERAEMFGHMESLSNAMVIEDTRSLLAALAEEPCAAAGPKGCIGYCMSGQFVMSVAGSFPEHFRASISCYGVGIVTGAEDSPHRLASKVQGEIFFAFAEKDEYVGDDVIESLRKSLETHDIQHAIDVYPGTEHGFCFPQREGAYAEDAAEDVWRRSFEIFDRQLRG